MIMIMVVEAVASLCSAYSLSRADQTPFEILEKAFANASADITYRSICRQTRQTCVCRARPLFTVLEME